MGFRFAGACFSAISFEQTHISGRNLDTSWLRLTDRLVTDGQIGAELGHKGLQHAT